MTNLDKELTPELLRERLQKYHLATMSTINEQYVTFINGGCEDKEGVAKLLENMATVLTDNSLALFQEYSNCVIGEDITVSPQEYKQDDRETVETVTKAVQAVIDGQRARAATLTGKDMK